MIGNDIVDLQLAQVQSNWQRKGFLEKQFTNAEQEIILNAENPFQQVWLFWSMKEAAYKCYTQLNQKRFFAPKKFECKMTCSNEGIITVEKDVFYTFSRMNIQFVHTIAKQNTQLETSNYSDFLIDKNFGESEFVKAKLLACFPKKTTLKKDVFGVPSLYEKNKLPIAISLTHHGNYGGFAYSKY
jgi:phosphopantetheinyl transferase (holo-ACP synthase)